MSNRFQVYDLLIPALCFATLSVTSISGCKTHEKPDSETLVFGSLTEPTSLDLSSLRTAGHREIFALIFRSLMKQNEKGDWIPDLAQDIPTIKEYACNSPPCFQVIWSIAESSNWAKYNPALDRVEELEPITPKDFERSYIGLQQDNPWISATTLQTNIVSIKINAEKNSRSFEAIVQHPPLLEADQYPLIPPTPNHSSGPYVLKEWKKGHSMLFLPRKKYTKAPKILFRFFQSEDHLYQALKDGSVHMIGESSGLSDEKIHYLATKTDLNLNQHYPGNWIHLSVNLEHPVLKDVRSRKCIFSILEAHGLSKQFGFIHTNNLTPPQQATDQTTHLENSISEQFTSTYCDQKSQQEIILAYASESSFAKKVALQIQAILKEKSYNIILETRPFSLLLEATKAHKHPGLFLLAYRASVDWNIDSFLKSTGKRNLGGYKSPIMDQKLDLFRDAGIREKRIEIFKEIEALFWADLPIIPLGYRALLSLSPKQLKNVRPTGAQAPITWNAEEWQLLATLNQR